MYPIDIVLPFDLAEYELDWAKEVTPSFSLWDVRSEVSKWLAYLIMPSEVYRNSLTPVVAKVSVDQLPFIPVQYGIPASYADCVRTLLNSVDAVFEYHTKHDLDIIDRLGETRPSFTSYVDEDNGVMVISLAYTLSMGQYVDHHSEPIGSPLTHVIKYPVIAFTQGDTYNTNTEIKLATGEYMHHVSNTGRIKHMGGVYVTEAMKIFLD